MSVSRDVSPAGPPSDPDGRDGADSNSFFVYLRRFRLIPDPLVVEANARRLRLARPEATAETLAKSHGAATVRRLTAIGGVAALPSAVPGFGTAAQALVMGSTMSSELLYTLRRLTQTQMEVAALHGLPIEDPDAPGELHPDRYEDLLIVWALGTGLVMPVNEAGRRVGVKVAIAQFNRHMSADVLRRINRKLGTTVFTMWGTRRGGIALGRLIPFGVGAAVGAGTNYVFARSLVHQIVRFHGELRPENAELFVEE